MQRCTQIEWSDYPGDSPLSRVGPSVYPNPVQVYSSLPTLVSGVRHDTV